MNSPSMFKELSESDSKSSFKCFNIITFNMLHENFVTYIVFRDFSKIYSHMYITLYEMHIGK